MRKEQITERMQKQMEEDFLVFSDAMPNIMSNEQLAQIAEQAFITGYRYGMDNMFNVMKDELLAEFA